MTTEPSKHVCLELWVISVPLPVSALLKERRRLLLTPLSVGPLKPLRKNLAGIDNKLTLNLCYSFRSFRRDIHSHTHGIPWFVGITYTLCSFFSHSFDKSEKLGTVAQNLESRSIVARNQRSFTFVTIAAVNCEVDI